MLARSSRMLPVFIAVGLWISDEVSYASESSSSLPEPPLKVFILAGQSNMQGHAHIRTIDTMALDPTTAPLAKSIMAADGTPRVCDKAWISSLGSAEKEKYGPLTTGFGAAARGPKIGPELTFGITVQKHLDEPILLIKTAWGGKSLNTDFRPPSAGPYTFNEDQKKRFVKQGVELETMIEEKSAATGVFYRLMLDHIQTVLSDIGRVYPGYQDDLGYELAGFVWFQGWNDMVDSGTYPKRGQEGGYSAYTELLTHFIRDVRRDLDAPQLPFVIGVMGVGGPVDLYSEDQRRYAKTHRNFRQAMAAPAERPEFKTNVSAVLTEAYWDHEAAGLRRKEKTLNAAKKELNAQAKNKEITQQKKQARIEALYRETFTEHELKVLRESTSNADFHYMGSAKIMAQIGVGFAEAMVALLKG